MYSAAYSLNSNITISAIDFYPLIQELASRNMYTGAASKFIGSFVDIEVLLEFGLMLDQEFYLEVFTHVTSNAILSDSGPVGGLLYFNAFQAGAYNIYTEHQSVQNIINASDLDTNPVMVLYPYTSWSTSTDVYGFVNLSINIKQKQWVTWILGKFLEDPDFMRRTWSYRLLESNVPIAADRTEGQVFTDISIQILAADYDQDSELDINDVDDDDDGIIDINDDCSLGTTGWISSSVTDYDNDGCQDASEDDDDDNDGFDDNADDCSQGSIGVGLDHDSDGCQDAEDDDDDNDGFTDSTDNCSQGSVGVGADFDSDGCQDTEDDDDDNDGFADSIDACSKGIIGVGTDYDSDGCQDAEDADDDNDGFDDNADDCSQGSIGVGLDHDSDGCQDAEDDDDDNDGVTDGADDCATGDLGWSSDESTDYDSDGCQDGGEDEDDDNDGFFDSEDDCPIDEGTSTIDLVGCDDEDGDGYSDSNGYLSTTFSKAMDGEVASLTIILSPLIIVILVIVLLRRRTGEDIENQAIIDHSTTNEINQIQAMSTELSVINQWTDENSNTWRKMSDGKTQWWDGKNWQDT
jgi:hypothetical protein